jgi:hypothetical protein
VITPNPYKSRKFLLAVGCIAIATALLLAGLIESEHWVDVTKWVTGLFMAGNVGEKVADTMKAKA